MIKQTFLILLPLFIFISLTSYSYTNDDILQAAKKNNICAMKAYINEKANINCQDNDGFTPLMFAAVNNYVELAKLLVSCKNINLDIRNNFGYTALGLAVVFGNIEIQNILKQAGAKE